jgi:hypothetical protein
MQILASFESPKFVSGGRQAGEGASRKGARPRPPGVVKCAAASGAGPGGKEPMCYGERCFSWLPDYISTREVR